MECRASLHCVYLLQSKFCLGQNQKRVAALLAATRFWWLANFCFAIFINPNKGGAKRRLYLGFITSYRAIQKQPNNKDDYVLHF